MSVDEIRLEGVGELGHRGVLGEQQANASPLLLITSGSLLSYRNIFVSASKVLLGRNSFKLLQQNAMFVTKSSKQSISEMKVFQVLDFSAKLDTAIS